MRALEIALILTVSASACDGQGVALIPYAPLKDRLDGHVGFSALPDRPEPGHNLDHPYVSLGLKIGSHFAGQSLGDRRGPMGNRHDALLSGNATAPLQLATGPPGQNLSVAFHRGFGSMALFPLGPIGYPDQTARGEGSAAFLFDTVQTEIGFRFHADYPAPLGNSAKPGAVHVTCLTRSGEVAATVDIPLATGITEIGLRFDGAAIRGCILTNTDPGGIAIDDVIYRLQALTG